MNKQRARLTASPAARSNLWYALHAADRRCDLAASNRIRNTGNFSAATSA